MKLLLEALAELWTWFIEKTKSNHRILVKYWYVWLTIGVVGFGLSALDNQKRVSRPAPTDPQEPPTVTAAP